MEKKRIRDFGIVPGRVKTGKRNTITENSDNPYTVYRLYQNHVRIVPEPYLGRTCSVSAPKL